MLKKIEKRVKSVSILLFIVCILTNVAYAGSGKVKFEYKETKDLVKFVNNAAELINLYGEVAFDEFRRKDGPWYKDNKYIFVDDMTGVEVVNPAFPNLEGKNIIDLQDKWGKFIVKDYIREVYKYGKNKPNGWFHYLWPRPDNGKLAWKTTYVARAVSPIGTKTEYVVGSGIYDMKMEKAFMADAVDDAVKVIQTKGKDKGLEMIKSKSEEFFYKNTYVFVTDEKGKELANTVFPFLPVQPKDLWAIQDMERNYVFREFVKIAKNEKSGWLVSVWTPEEKDLNIPVFRNTYIRGIRVNDELLIVGTTAILDKF